nr:calcium/proton exchanger [Tanacetum cinerariifolium]
MEPILGMRFETPHQLKMALENYDVAHGYQLWEQSFQTKSLRSEHKCCRNYNIGSLVTYKWIVVQYFKEIIEDSFMPLRKIRDDIRQKFMMNVSVGQCKRAKQLALFDHEGGLIEHYAKLYQYRQAILDSNPGSTCTMDVVESDNGSVSFKRMYICFKGVKDGWLAGCRKIKLLDANAYDYLIQRNPNSWSRAFFEMDRRCAAFENGISKSFNKAILGPSMKPIITMLEEIRLYIMQRTMAMNKLAFSLEDTITPSIMKREWESWFNAYQFSIKRVFGTNMWKKTNDVPPLPPIIIIMPGRPQKKEFKPQVKLVGASGSGVNNASGSGVNACSGSGVTNGSGSGGRGGGRAGGSGKRGSGRADRGSERGSRGGVFPSLSICGILTAEQEYQLEVDEQAFRECMKEQARVVDNYMC